jgi:hypothetical protein
LGICHSRAGGNPYEITLDTRFRGYDKKTPKNFIYGAFIAAATKFSRILIVNIF